MPQVPTFVRETPHGLPLATKNVLLVTCMDLRLLDDVVRFMDGENLTNRYDQFISAGASLSLTRPAADVPDTFASCRQAFYDHLEMAIALHQIKYVYIVEHMNCGAYQYVHIDYSKCKPGEREWRESVEWAEQRKMAEQFREDILRYAELKHEAPGAIPVHDGDPRRAPFRAADAPAAIHEFTRLIHNIYEDRYLRPPAPPDWVLKVYTLRMDLRGTISLFTSPEKKAGRKAPKASRPARKTTRTRPTPKSS